MQTDPQSMPESLSELSQKAAQKTVQKAEPHRSQNQTAAAVTEHRLQQAAAVGLLQTDQVQPLWQFLQQQAELAAQQPAQHGLVQFKTAHLLYYFGGLLAIVAMSLLMTLSHEHYGGNGLAVLAGSYGLLGVALAEYCRQRGQSLLTGIFGCFAVVQTPLLVFGLLLGQGLWDEREYLAFHQWVDGRWLYLELATLFTASLALYRYRLPFLLLPVAVVMWYLSMDLAPLLLQHADADWQARKWVAVAWGLLTLWFAFYIDLRDRSRLDFAFWLYLSGLLSFWGGLTALDSDNEWGRAAYALINIVLLFKGVALQRQMFVVFGALGVLLYVGHLAFELFADSNWFPLVLCAVGFAVIYAGVWWQRHQHWLALRLQALLPEMVRQLVARRRG